VSYEAARHLCKGTTAARQKQPKKIARQRGFWQIKALYMRILSTFLRWLCPGAAALALPFLCAGADKPVNVVLQYHFLGAAPLAESTNAAVAKRVFALPSTLRFEDLVLKRLSASLADSLHFQTNQQTVSLLRPLLDDLLRAESIASLGGSSSKPINYVLAIHLDSQRAQVWRENLKTASHGPGEELRAETFSGWQWNKGASDSFWMVPARDWLLVGRGGDLASVRSDYLRQIQKTGRPGPALGSNWFEADVDWPRLANWFPLSSCPLKLARTQIAISAKMRGFHMTGHVTYPEAIQWQPHPMSLPTNLVREPLVSFATGQNVEPFLKSDETLSRFCANPLSDQFYFWSMSEMPFESYVAWPANNPSNTLLTLSGQAIDALNPKLQKFDGTKLTWSPKTSQLVWTKLQIIVPIMAPAPEGDGPFLVAGLFPVMKGTGPAPQELWKQFKGRTDLVYYDWELTGPRVQRLLPVTEVLPILQMLGVGPRESFVDGASPAKPGTNTLVAPGVQSRLNAQKEWLLGLTPFLGNTVTEVTKTGPNELTILRNSPFVFSSLELVLLSHWLSDTPAGPLDWSLLPQPKVSRSGLPPPSH
jgi:hypothetical protein